MTEGMKKERMNETKNVRRKDQKKGCKNERKNE